jgi:hypothetical protein
MCRTIVVFGYDGAVADHHHLYIDPPTNLGLPSQRHHPYLKLLPAVCREQDSADGILLATDNLTEPELHFRYRAFLPARLLSTVCVGRAACVFFRPQPH